MNERSQSLQNVWSPQLNYGLNNDDDDERN